MRLNKIVLNGFKSFADKTEFVFDKNITAVVGPNGCGKSNIVDAVKWVLGEQSKKSLRSSQMIDVIFSGSSKRKPSGMAEVVMTFGDIPGEQEELEITRRLYRNGESTYLINGKTCRLKDLRERFMDTGVGVSAYSIIEQGQIAQLLNASKIERRLIFEEAAGISKFKAQKKEAQRKLEKTEQRMLRVADIFNELQKQLRSIKMQAGKARNYVEYKQQLDKLRMSYSLAEYHRLTSKHKITAEKLAATNSSCSGMLSELSRLEAKQASLRDAIHEKEMLINEMDQKFISIRGKIEQNRERTEFLNKRFTELASRKNTATERIHLLENQKSRMTGEFEACQYRLTENEKEAQEKQIQLSSLQEMLREVEMEASTIEARVEDEKALILETVRKTAQVKNDIHNAENHRKNLDAQKQTLQEKLRTLTLHLDEAKKDRQEYTKKFDEVSVYLEELNNNLEEVRVNLDQLNSENREKVEMAAGEKQEKSAIEREYGLLKELERNNEGVSESAKRVLKDLSREPERFDYIKGIVADFFTADMKYATAVEAALEDKVNWFVVEDLERFTQDWKSIADAKGRLTALLVNQQQKDTNTSSEAKSLSELVECDLEFVSLRNALLGNFYVADDIESAFEISRKLGADSSVVTLSGEVISGGEIVKFGKSTGSTGLISRKSRMEQLVVAIEDIKQRIEYIELGIEENNQQLEALSEQTAVIRGNIQQTNSDKYEAQSKLRLVCQSIENLEKDLPLSAQQLSTIDERIAQEIEAKRLAELRLTEIEQANTTSNSLIEELQMQAGEKKAVLGEINSQVTSLRITIGQTTVKRNAITQEANSLQMQIGRIANNIISAQNDLFGSDDQVDNTMQAVLNAESELSDLFMNKEAVLEKASLLRKEGAELVEQLVLTDEDLQLKKQQAESSEKLIHQLELELNEVRIKTEDLVQKVSEELSLDISEEYGKQEFEEQDVDWDAVRSEMNDLKARISRLGNVNVDAIEQQNELEEREQFLSEQIKDLTDSKNKLVQLINKINKESREKFKITFDEVRMNFRELFRKLFGGGKADVILEDEDGDILECGIEIIAQPPGKGAKSISLLSGGEKTMTAMALLFSIFKSKPSPFCFLDEVDAALDEANNERFNLIVQEFQQQSQFVIVTHAKRTMSIADKLFGVTMQQHGVSKRITVKFDKNDEPDAA